MKTIAGGKRESGANERHPRYATTKRPDPERVALQRRCATPSGSEIFTVMFRGRRSLCSLCPRLLSLSPSGILKHALITYHYEEDRHLHLRVFRRRASVRRHCA